MTTVSQATTAFMQKLGETSSEEEHMAVLNSEVDLNFQFGEYTPFMFAISQGCAPALVEEMIALGANPLVCIDGISALDIAAKSHQNPEVVKILARQRFDTEALTKALFLAAGENSNYEILLELVRAGADPLAEIGGNSLLMMAAANNPCFDVVRMALELEWIKRDILEGLDETEESELSEVYDELNQFRILVAAMFNPDPAILFAICEEGFRLNCLLNDEHADFLLDLSKTVPELFSKIVRAADVLLAANPEYLPPLSHIAMFNANSVLIPEFVRAGADPDQENPCGALPMLTALSNRHGVKVSMQMIKCLIENGADINLISSKGMAPLHFAMFAKQPSPEMIECLLQSGAKADLITENGKSMLEVGILAGVDDKIVKLLLSHGADPCQESADGCTPVHRAIANGRLDLLKLFLETGFPIKEKFADHGSALHYAVDTFHCGLDCSHVENLLGDSIGNLCAGVVELIVASGIDVNEKDSEGQTALEIALLNPVCHIEVVEKLIDLGAEINSLLTNSYTPLMTAAGFAFSESVSLLLKKGADVNAKLSDGGQAIHLVAEYNFDHEIISLLVEAGADINSRRNDRTPLHLAIKANENMAVINRLIDVGADIEAKDNAGSTPLFYAVVAEKKAVDKTRALLAAGASANAAEGNGYTPLFYATSTRNIEKILDLLLDFGADINCRAISGYTPLFEMVLTRRATTKKLQALIDRGADINIQENKCGYSCLHLAVTQKDLKSARLLIDFGIDIDLPDKKGHTALALCLAASFNRKIFQLLLESGADVNATDNEGCSVLHHAASLQDDEIILALLQAGADAGPADSDELAEELSHEPVETKSRKRTKSAEKENKTPKLVITKRIEAENFLVMSLTGYFGRATTEQFLAEVAVLQTVSFKDLILDFANVEFMDVPALGALAKVLMTLNTMEKRMVIINLYDSTLFTMSKFDEILTIRDNLEEALSFLRAPVD